MTWLAVSLISFWILSVVLVLTMHKPHPFLKRKPTVAHGQGHVKRDSTVLAQSIYYVFSRDVTAAVLVSLNKERRRCSCPQLFLRKLSNIVMQTFSYIYTNLAFHVTLHSLQLILFITFSFVSVEKQGYWSREWKLSIWTIVQRFRTAMGSSIGQGWIFFIYLCAID